MKNIGLIIFSKNRPLQLECLLRSITDNSSVFNDVYIQYYSDDYFLEGYEILKSEYSNFHFINEKSLGFKETLITIMEKIQKFICFMVDDNILFKPIYEIPECDIFSLRLGDNITFKSHFNYPGSVDGNIFNKKLLVNLKNKTFINPNKLEIVINNEVRGFKINYSDSSKLIGIPNNKVSDTSRCFDMGIDVIILNDLFLNNKRINYKKMDLSHNNVHKHINYIIE